MKFVVCFKPGTTSDYGARLIVNVPFLRLRPKSVAILITYSNDGRTIDMAEIFICNDLVSEVPKFFVGELKMLSSQILNVSRA